MQKTYSISVFIQKHHNFCRFSCRASFLRRRNTNVDGYSIGACLGIKKLEMIIISGCVLMASLLGQKANSGIRHCYWRKLFRCRSCHCGCRHGIWRTQTALNVTWISIVANFSIVIFSSFKSFSLGRFSNWCWLGGALSKSNIESKSANRSRSEFKASVWNLHSVKPSCSKNYSCYNHKFCFVVKWTFVAFYESA